MGASTSRKPKLVPLRSTSASGAALTISDDADTREDMAPDLADKPLTSGVSGAEAARRIRAYVAKHPGSDAFDIGVALGLPWRRVRRIAGDLMSKGQLIEQE